MRTEKPRRAGGLAYVRSTLLNVAALVGSYRRLLGDRVRAFSLLGVAVLAGALLDGLGIALVMPLVEALQGADPASFRFAPSMEALGLSSLASIAAAVGFVYLTKNALALLRIRMSLRVLYESWSSWVAEIVGNVLRAPVTTYESEKPGALLSVAMQQSMESTIGLRQLLELGVSFATLLVTYIVLLIVSWKATLLLSLMLFLFGFLVVRPLTRAAHGAGAELVRANKAANATFLEILGGIRYVKAYAQETRFSDRMNQSLDDFRRSLISATWSGALVHPLVETVVVLLFCAVIIVLAGRSGDLSRELPMLAVLVAAAFRLFPILSGLGSQWVAFISKQPAAEAVLAALEPRGVEPTGHRPFASLETDVVFDRVGFTYPGRAPALRAASLELKRGSRTALVGESGSGKSTVVALLLGFLTPESGEIRVDGTPLGELRLADWRRCIGYVGQEGFVFNATLGENVTLGRSDLSDPRLGATLRATGLDEILGRLPQGLDTVVGERGVELSGGQRQRVALARAVLLDPGILVLDEATSALDNEAAFRIMKGVQALLPATTIVSVAHRLGGTSGFDRIYVLRAGRIVEEGTHRELLGLGGYYQQLYDHERAPEASL